MATKPHITREWDEHWNPICVPDCPACQEKASEVTEGTLHRMTNEEYIKLAGRTESKNFEDIRERLQNDTTLRVLHAFEGLDTEQAELMDALKKHLFYGRELDRTNIIEEVGDIFWYLAILADALGFTFEEAQTKNIAKLAARYGDKFSEFRAVNRDLETERKILDADPTILKDPNWERVVATATGTGRVSEDEMQFTVAVYEPCEASKIETTYKVVTKVDPPVICATEPFDLPLDLHNHMMERECPGWTKATEKSQPYYDAEYEVYTPKPMSDSQFSTLLEAMESMEKDFKKGLAISPAQLERETTAKLYDAVNNDANDPETILPSEY